MRDFCDYLLLGLLPFWEEFFRLLSSLAWPISIVLVAFLFRSSIRVLIGRVQTLSASGFEVSLGDNQENLEGKSIKKSLETLKRNVLKSKPIQDIEKTFLTELENVNENERQELLLTALAQSRLEGVFNLAYANIFGSQIRTLRRINELGGRISQELAFEQFNKLKTETNFPSDWTLDRYYNYLRGYLFIDEIQGEFVLSDYGREFLAYLSRKGLSEDRQL